jgi:DNA-binding SARP family transcriptional activator
VPLPLSAQRLLALLALRDHPLLRVHVAGVLWLEATEERALGSLRSALWRVHQPGHHLIQATTTHLCLAPGVEVDLHEATSLARSLIGSEQGAEAGVQAGASRSLLSGVLLPDWYDDWVLMERERFRQLSLHALEALSDRLAAEGRFGEAAEAALAAVAGEPLRESAHRALIRVHLAEGNRSEARRQYELFRSLLASKLGLEPSPVLEALVSGLTI